MLDYVNIENHTIKIIKSKRQFQLQCRFDKNERGNVPKKSHWSDQKLFCQLANKQQVASLPQSETLEWAVYSIIA